MSTEDLEQYARHTTKKPMICFFALAASPFVMEILCRVAEIFLK